MHKAFKACTAVLLALVMTVSLVNGALAAVVRNDDDTISYEPLEQGVYSKGGYTIDKVSHPMLRRSVCCLRKINKYQKVAYFRAFCEVCAITGALRKVRFSCMETYPLSEFAGQQKMSGRV